MKIRKEKQKGKWRQRLRKKIKEKTEIMMKMIMRIFCLFVAGRKLPTWYRAHVRHLQKWAAQIAPKLTAQDKGHKMKEKMKENEEISRNNEKELI